MSEALPKPPEAEPAKNERVPFRSWLGPADSGATEPSSSTRRIGRLEAERSTHFQSSSSLAAPRNAGSWIASNSPLSLRSTIALLPVRSRAQHFHHRAHLGDAGGAAHISRNRAGPWTVGSQHWKRQRHPQ